MITARHRIVTDRRNLFSWLSRGLITPPSLMIKYRQDNLAGQPDHLTFTTDLLAWHVGQTENPVACELMFKADADRATPLVLTGAVATARITRIVVPTEHDRGELKARAYRGFDLGSMVVAVDPTVFGGAPFEAAIPSAQVYDDSALRRREAVAGALSVLCEETLTRRVLAGDGDQDAVDLLVDAIDGSGLIVGASDLAFLRAVLNAIMDVTEGVDLVPTNVIERLRGTLPPDDAGNRYLDRITELLRGEAETEFKTGGMLAGKALALFLLRPSVEGVKSWNNDGIEVESAVLTLAVMLSGLATRFGGLDLSDREGAAGVLDWVATGLKPNEVTALLPNLEPEAAGPGQGVELVGVELSTEPAARSDDALSVLMEEVAAGDHKRAVELASVAGWEDTLRLSVLSAEARSTVQGRRVRVDFAPGAVPEWRVDAESLLSHAESLDGETLSHLLEEVDKAYSPRRRPPRKRSGSGRGKP